MQRLTQTQPRSKKGLSGDAVNPSLEASAKTFCAIAILHRAESQGFAIPGKSRTALRAEPLFLTTPESPFFARVCARRAAFVNFCG
jgi:hypothetical protein